MRTTTASVVRLWLALWPVLCVLIATASLLPAQVQAPKAGKWYEDSVDLGFKIYPAQRAGDPHDIGAAAAYLASDDAAYCMGTELLVDGGLTAGHYYAMMPGAPPSMQH